MGKKKAAVLYLDSRQTRFSKDFERSGSWPIIRFPNSSGNFY